MCYSKTVDNERHSTSIPYNYKLLEELDNNCDYVDIDARSEIASDNKSLNIVQLNIRGLTSKISLLTQLLMVELDQIKPDVVLLCETWLNGINFAKVNIPNYKLFGNVRNGKISGGTGILVCKNLRCRERKDLEIESKTFEYTIVELCTETGNMLLVSGYRPPNGNAKTTNL